MGTVNPDVSAATDDATVADLLPTITRVAVVGVSDRFTRPSFRLATYLLDRTAWDVALVNPHVVETLGRLCTPTLAYLDERPDLVVVFRHPRAWLDVVDDTAEAGARAVWLPTGTDASDNLPVPGVPPSVPGRDEVVERGAQRGLTVVLGRDLRADHRRWCADGDGR